jgi:cell division GTPase FtsZ
MLKAKFIGTGACGNKAVVYLIEQGIIRKEDAIILNSTLKDVPEAYREHAIQFVNSTGGCGKEIDLSKQLTLETLEAEALPLESFMDPDDSMLIIITSLEGGTGPGSAIILADYAKTALGLNVKLFTFAGFEDDPRGLENSIEFFQEMQETYEVECISNKKFLDQANGNKLKAEVLANDECARRISILLGLNLTDSVQNIDDTDLYKVSAATPGFMDIEYSILDKVKNVESFNKTIIEMLDNSKSLDFEPSAKRIAVILNISEKTRDFIDYSFSVIKERMGIPYEVYTHIQYEGDTEYVAVIASGLKMPLDEVKAIYERYKEQSGKVNKKKDDFYSFAGGLRGNNEDSMFNATQGRVVGNPKATEKNKKDFFNKFRTEDPSPKQTQGTGTFANTNVGKVVTAKQEKSSIDKY